MPSEESEARELTPFAKNVKNLGGFKDFTFYPEKSEPPTEEPTEVPGDIAEEVEVEEALTPAPKDSSVLESAISSGSPPTPQSEGHALPGSVLPTESLEDAVKESGKDSVPSEDEPQPPSQTTPAPESSSPDSSSETSPGSNTPPAPVPPPTGSKNPKL